MSTDRSYDVVMVGHFAKDRNVIDGHGEVQSGGAVYFGSVVLARLGLKVAVVTRLHPDDMPLLDEVKREGVDVYATPARETSGIENIYVSSDMERRICKPLGFAGPIEFADLPDVNAHLYAVVPIIAGEISLDLLKRIAARGPVALDIQGFVRVRKGNNLVHEPWRDLTEGLEHVAFLKVDRTEAELLSGSADLHAAAKKLAGYGPREIVLTQSSGVTVFAQGSFFEAPFTSRQLTGRTGRGDTCFAAYLGARLSALPLAACRLAAAVTTMKQESPGPWRGTLEQAQALVRAM